MYVTYSNPNDFKAGADRGPQFNPFGPTMMAFTSPEDLMKNLPKAMANIGIVAAWAVDFIFDEFQSLELLFPSI